MINFGCMMRCGHDADDALMRYGHDAELPPLQCMLMLTGKSKRYTICCLKLYAFCNCHC